MTLGEQIKKAREKKNLSQEELAERLGVSRQAVSKWENDSAAPQGINREVLSQVLEMEMENAEEIPAGNRKPNWIGWLGWLAAAALLVVLLIVMRSEAAEGDPADAAGGEKEPPAINNTVKITSIKGEIFGFLP